ncbi:hypothetical protein ACQY0O_001954 [Thecaphora frezii]
MLFKPALLALLGLTAYAFAEDLPPVQQSKYGNFSCLHKTTQTTTTDGNSVKLYNPDHGSVKDDAPAAASQLKNTNPVFWVKSGSGACSNYTDSSMTACIDSNWLENKEFPCEQWVEVNYNGTQIQARVQDTCPGAGCDGVFLSKRAFTLLAGKQASDALASGRLPAGKVTWKFLDSEPWWGCLAGLPGRKSSGGKDSCKGNDDYNCHRYGRRHSTGRITGPQALSLCNATAWPDHPSH